MNFRLNLKRVILWQYENTNLSELISEMQSVNHSLHGDFWQHWLEFIFDLTNSSSFGVALWAKILNEPISVNYNLKASEDFGFGEGLANFENGSFGVPFSEFEGLSTDLARKILLVKWFKMTQAPTVPNINRLLSFLFEDLRVYLDDRLDMSIEYVFYDEPSWRLKWLILNHEVLPKPAAVSMSLRIAPSEGFGFGINHLNFERGAFPKRRSF